MKKTHFGFKTIDMKDKQSKVNQVFDSVVNRYDLMNDLMSIGLHRIWKYQAINQLSLKSGDRVLDLASGSGDLSVLAKQIVGSSGMVISTDINLNMLKLGRKKIINNGANCQFIQMDGQKIAFKNDSFDALMIGFGLRNFPNINASLKEVHRVLKPKARVIILEFSEVQSKVASKAYDFYSFSLLPLMGKVIAQDEDSYRYLAESIRKHPNQEKLAKKLSQAGFKEVGYINLMNGIVAIHHATKD